MEKMRLAQVFGALLLHVALVSPVTVMAADGNCPAITCGAQGPLGPPGPPGPQGNTGHQGPVGKHGPPGSKGSTGDKGVTGASGPIGPPGAAGPQGQKGEQGPIGPQGVAGPKGQKGEQGPIGPQGVAGPKGQNGEQGPIGPQGVAGPKGQKGEQGPIGPQGVAGPKGQKGEQGAIGPRGVAGPQGQKGEQGAIGPRGVAGPQGQKGEKGPIGPQGVAGPKGESNTDGLRDLQAQIERLTIKVTELQSAVTKNRDTLEYFKSRVTIGEKLYATNGAIAGYADGEMLCRKAGGKRAAPRNSEENEALLSLRNQLGTNILLGYDDINNEGAFEEYNGEKVTYTNWEENQPDNNDGKENCVEMRSTGKWNDMPCGTKYIVICEFKK